MYTSIRGVVRIHLLFLFGLLPFVPIKEHYLDLPFFTPEFLADQGVTSRKYLAGAAFFRFLLFNPLVMWSLKRRGILVNAWTLNYSNACL